MNIYEMAEIARLKRYQVQGQGIDVEVGYWADLKTFVALVEAAARADEREECAKVIELHAGIIDTPNAFIDGPSNFAKTKARDLADSIRARGTT